MAKGSSKALALLTPTSIEVKDDDGSTIRVPINSDENRIMGALMAAKIRKLILDSMKAWKDTGEIPSPKELADLAAAAAKVEAFAGELFKGSEIAVAGDKEEADAPKEEKVAFDVLVSTPEPKKE